MSSILHNSSTIIPLSGLALNCRSSVQNVRKMSNIHRIMNLHDSFSVRYTAFTSFNMVHFVSKKIFAWHSLLQQTSSFVEVYCTVSAAPDSTRWSQSKRINTGPTGKVCTSPGRSEHRVSRIAAPLEQ